MPVVENMSAPGEAAVATDQVYIIASVKHTGREHAHISFWGPDSRGYILALADGRVGTYTAEQVRKSGLNDGHDCIAVPFDAVMELRSPTPYFRLRNGQACQFYDTAGPVVENTRANWDRLIGASLPRPVGDKPKPMIFRGKRRSFSLESLSPGLSAAAQADETADQEAPRG